MRKNSFGRIICLGSEIGLVGANNHAAFATVKGGLWGFVRTLSLEGEKKNIKANLVIPHANTRISH